MVQINAIPNLKTRQEIPEDTSGIYDPYDFEASAEEREENEELKERRREILEDTPGIYEPYDFEASAEERERNDELNLEDNTYAQYGFSEATEQPSRLKQVFHKYKWYFAAGILLLLTLGMF